MFLIDAIYLDIGARKDLILVLILKIYRIVTLLYRKSLEEIGKKYFFKIAKK